MANRQARRRGTNVSAARLFDTGAALMAAGRMGEAEQAFRAVLAQAPRFDAHYNLGVLLYHKGDLLGCILQYEAALKLAPHDQRIHNALVGPLIQLGDEGRARQHGLKALAIKQAEAQAAFAGLQADLPPPPGRSNGTRQIIAFSLWGALPLYVEGAIGNVAAARQHYPGWVCRFYCDDSVPAEARARLVEEGAELVLQPRPAAPFEGLFWRFAVSDDPEVARFLVRDCDSRPGAREAAAVRAWIDSGADFHLMRDSLYHAELILAGMWGGVAGLLPPVSAALPVWREKRFAAINAKVADQLYLRDIVWPLIEGRTCAHDSAYGFAGAHPFPDGALAQGELPVAQRVVPRTP